MSRVANIAPELMIFKQITFCAIFMLEIKGKYSLESFYLQTKAVSSRKYFLESLPLILCKTMFAISLITGAILQGSIQNIAVERSPGSHLSLTKSLYNRNHAVTLIRELREGVKLSGDHPRKSTQQGKESNIHSESHSKQYNVDFARKECTFRPNRSRTIQHNGLKGCSTVFWSFSECGLR